MVLFEELFLKGILFYILEHSPQWGEDRKFSCFIKDKKTEERIGICNVKKFPIEFRILYKDPRVTILIIFKLASALKY